MFRKQYFVVADIYNDDIRLNDPLGRVSAIIKIKYADYDTIKNLLKEKFNLVDKTICIITINRL